MIRLRSDTLAVSRDTKEIKREGDVQMAEIKARYEGLKEAVTKKWKLIYILLDKITYIPPNEFKIFPIN